MVIAFIVLYSINSTCLSAELIIDKEGVLIGVEKIDVNGNLYNVRIIGKMGYDEAFEKNKQSFDMGKCQDILDAMEKLKNLFVKAYKNDRLKKVYVKPSKEEFSELDDIHTPMITKGKQWCANAKKHEHCDYWHHPIARFSKPRYGLQYDFKKNKAFRGFIEPKVFTADYVDVPEGAICVYPGSKSINNYMIWAIWEKISD
jgi:hypothetical protein